MDDFVRFVLAALSTVCCFLFGEMDKMFVALVVMIVLDYITGVVAAATEHNLNSDYGAKGIAKKLFMIAIVAVANIIDTNIIGDGNTLRTVTTVFYISNEAISLLENAGRLGVPLPKKLIDVLGQLKVKKESEENTDSDKK